MKNLQFQTSPQFRKNAAGIRTSLQIYLTTRDKMHVSGKKSTEVRITQKMGK